MKIGRFLKILVLSIFILASCTNNNANDADLGNESSENNAENFSFKKTETEDFEIHENENLTIKIKNNLDKKDEIVKKIAEDYKKISTFKTTDKLSIEVDDFYTEAYIDSSLFCSSNFIMKNDFRKLLIENSYNLYDNWKIEGIYSYIFENQNDKSDFSNYYKVEEFSLFGARFFEDFSSKEYIENIKSASFDLVKYLIENGKKEELLTEKINIGDIKNWAEKNNIDISYYSNVYDYINNIKVIKPLNDALLSIETKQEVNGFKIEILRAYEFTNSSKRLEERIKIFNDDIANNINIIKTEAPNFYKKHEEALTNKPKITYIFNFDLENNFYEPQEKTIYLRHVLVQMAEYNNFLFDMCIKDIPDENKVVWLEGAVDYYLSSYSSAYKEDLKLFINSLNTSKTIDRFKIMENSFKLNFPNLTDPNNIDNLFNDKKFRNKLIHVLYAPALIYPKEFSSDNQNDEEINSTKNLNHEGINKALNLNPYARYSFSAYLIEKYGLEKILDLRSKNPNEISFENHFEKTYEELVEEWNSYLKENIKSLE